MPRKKAKTKIPNYEEKKTQYNLYFGDDLGYGDLSAYRAEKFLTPNIDRLASNRVLMFYPTLLLVRYGLHIGLNDRDAIHWAHCGKRKQGKYQTGRTYPIRR